MIITIDTETHLIKPGNLAPRIVALGYQVLDRNINYDPDQVLDRDPEWKVAEQGILIRDEAKEWVVEVLDTASRKDGPKIVGHFFAFDAAAICGTWPDLVPLVFAAYEADGISCTWAREMLLDIAIEGHVHKRKGWYSLEQLADRRTGMQLEKDYRRLTYSALDGLPVDQWPPTYRDYLLAGDVTATSRCWMDQQRAVKADADIFFDEPAQARAYFALYLATAWGIRTDGKKVAELKKSIEVKREGLAAQLLQLGILRKDGSRDMKLLQEKVAAALGTRAPKTPKGKIGTDVDAIDAAAKCDPQLEVYAAYQADANVLNTFIPQLERGAHEILHPRYSLTTGGRTSASDPNIQQMPCKPGVRECFIPRPGAFFIGCDYDTLELRTLAQVCLWIVKYSKLAQALNNGLDPHLWVAAILLGISYDEAQRLKSEGGESGHKIKEARQLAKVANFGFPGGMSEGAFSDYAKGYGLKVDMGQAQKLRSTWLRAWPEMTEFFAYVSGVVGPLEGTIVQPVSSRRRGRCGYCNGCNTYFQGLAADGAKAAVWRVQVEAYTQPDSALYGSRLVAFVHDELILEAPEARASEAAERLQTVMCSEMQSYLPDVKVTASPVVMRYWSKEAESIKDTAGKWMPWPKEVSR